MTDNTLTSDEIKVSKQKLKAIHPHIVVGGSILKPYYSIEWYDIEKETTTIGFSSYSLPFVFKWLKEEFEVIDEDIDNLINRQKAEIERSIEERDTAIKDLEEFAQRAFDNPFACRLCVHYVENGRACLWKAEHEDEEESCLGRHFEYRKETEGKEI